MESKLSLSERNAIEILVHRHYPLWTLQRRFALVDLARRGPNLVAAIHTVLAAGHTNHEAECAGV